MLVDYYLSSLYAETNLNQLQQPHTLDTPTVNVNHPPRCHSPSQITSLPRTDSFSHHHVPPCFTNFYN
jgi:hypothetical protein